MVCRILLRGDGGGFDLVMSVYSMLILERSIEAYLFAADNNWYVQRDFVLQRIKCSHKTFSLRRPFRIVMLQQLFSSVVATYSINHSHSAR